MGKREDDKFMRKIIWYLGGITLTSALAIAAMQVQINGNSKAVEEIRETNKTLNKININMQKLIDSGNHRNDLLASLFETQKTLSKRQRFIFGEQKERTPKFKMFQKHIDNSRRHM